MPPSPSTRGIRRRPDARQDIRRWRNHPKRPSNGRVTDQSSRLLRNTFFCTPAQAGKPPKCRVCRWCSSFHPCARRETGSRRIAASKASHSPLRMQGKQRPHRREWRACTFTPAHAGKPWNAMHSRMSSSFQPCERREAAFRYHVSACFHLSPLRRQGTHYVMTSELKPDPFTPAHAGHPIVAANISAVLHLIPLRMQGNRHQRFGSYKAPPFTPAHAGNPARLDRPL